MIEYSFMRLGTETDLTESGLKKTINCQHINSEDFQHHQSLHHGYLSDSWFLFQEILKQDPKGEKGYRPNTL